MKSGQPLVVVVEDDAAMNLAMQSLLRAAGFETSMHTSAEALLATGMPAGASCFLLDVNLPGISGFELHARLSGSPRRPPVIFMTAYDEPRARARAQEAGALAYLVKPFEGKALITTLRRVAQRN